MSDHDVASFDADDTVASSRQTPNLLAVSASDGSLAYDPNSDHQLSAHVNYIHLSSDAQIASTIPDLDSTRLFNTNIESATQSFPHITLSQNGFLLPNLTPEQASNKSMEWDEINCNSSSNGDKNIVEEIPNNEGKLSTSFAPEQPPNKDTPSQLSDKKLSIEILDYHDEELPSGKQSDEEDYSRLAPSRIKQLMQNYLDEDDPLANISNPTFSYIKRAINTSQDEEEEENNNEELPSTNNISENENRIVIEELIPIRLDLSSGDWHLRDQFLWSIVLPDDIENSVESDYITYNLLNREIPKFATRLTEDLDFPHSFESAVVKSMRLQIALHIPVLWSERKSIIQQNKKNAKPLATLTSNSTTGPEEGLNNPSAKSIIVTPSHSNANFPMTTNQSMDPTPIHLKHNEIQQSNQFATASSDLDRSQGLSSQHSLPGNQVFRSKVIPGAYDVKPEVYINSTQCKSQIADVKSNPEVSSLFNLSQSTKHHGGDSLKTLEHSNVLTSFNSDSSNSQQTSEQPMVTDLAASINHYPMPGLSMLSAPNAITDPLQSGKSCSPFEQQDSALTSSSPSVNFTDSMNQLSTAHNNEKNSSDLDLDELDQNVLMSSLNDSDDDDTGSNDEFSRQYNGESDLIEEDGFSASEELDFVGDGFSNSQRLVRQNKHHIDSKSANAAAMQKQQQRKKRKYGSAFEAHELIDERIAIKLNLAIGGVKLIDQFDWDPANDESWALMFARRTALELGLTREMAQAIALEIIRQVSSYFAASRNILPDDWKIVRYRDYSLQMILPESSVQDPKATTSSTLNKMTHSSNSPALNSRHLANSLSTPQYPSHQNNYNSYNSHGSSTSHQYLGYIGDKNNSKYLGHASPLAHTRSASFSPSCEFSDFNTGNMNSSVGNSGIESAKKRFELLISNNDAHLLNLSSSAISPDSTSATAILYSDFIVNNMEFNIASSEYKCAENDEEDEIGMSTPATWKKNIGSTNYHHFNNSTNSAPGGFGPSLAANVTPSNNSGYGNFTNDSNMVNSNNWTSSQTASGRDKEGEKRHLDSPQLPLLPETNEVTSPCYVPMTALPILTLKSVIRDSHLDYYAPRLMPHVPSLIFWKRQLKYQNAQNEHYIKRLKKMNQSIKESD